MKIGKNGNWGKNKLGKLDIRKNNIYGKWKQVKSLLRRSKRKENGKLVEREMRQMGWEIMKKG